MTSVLKALANESEQSPPALCRCGRPNFLPAMRRSRVYDVGAGEWMVVEEPQEGWPDHPCCHYWMVTKSQAVCRGCEGSRAAEGKRKGRS